MAGRRTAWVGLALLILPAHPGARADEPDAAALVRAAREAEAWIDRVESLWIKADVAWERTPEGIARRREQLRVERPGEDVEGDSSLQPRGSQQTELAFDRKRVRTWNRWPWGVDDLGMWDGFRYIGLDHVPADPDRDGVLFAPRPEGRIDALSNFASFRTGLHAFWWIDPQENATLAGAYGDPTDFVDAGEADFDGTPCRVACRWGTWDRLYFSLADGRLRGLKVGAQSDTRPDMNARLLDFFRREGEDLADAGSLAAWLKAQTAEERKATDRRLSANMLELTEPILEFGLADSKEVAPGRWLPMTQTTVIRSLDGRGRKVVDLRKTLTITEVHVDGPLPDSLFRVEIPEGTRVIDQVHRPPLVYRHKAAFTPEEWRQIVAEGEARAGRDEAYERAQQALIGRPAPEFPEGATWLNGEPVRWADLAGKRVVLDFWADWCGPCRNGLPSLAAVHRRRGENGLIVIGIHPPGSDLASIRKVMKEFSLDYPTCLDVPADERAGFWGVAFERFQVNRIPHAVLVDRRGRIAKTGDVNEVLLEALKPEADGE